MRNTAVRLKTMRSSQLILAVILMSACHSFEPTERDSATMPDKASANLVPSFPHCELRARSPDGRFGVTVPLIFEGGGGPNCLVEIKTGKVLVELPGWSGFEPMNRGGCEGIWSEDGSILVWLVTGKWTSDSVVVVKLNGDRVEWAKDITPASQRAILDGAKAADPAAYEREKEWNKGSGAAYPEGFTVDVRIVDAEHLRLPLTIHVDMTSDPKGIHGEDRESKRTVEGWCDATLDEHGDLSFGLYHSSRRPGLKNSWSY